MNYARILLCLTLLFGFSIKSFAQELDCRVVINAQLIQSTERRVFQEMESEFSRFINERKWTDGEFQNNEKIKCAIMINLEEQPNVSNFNATVQIISIRPVYGTTYETSLINFADRNFDFEYTQSQPMNYTENSYTSNITSLLAYYAYMVLAYDYDSFSNLGGDRMFTKAWEVVNTAQQSGYTGWDQFSSVRNRYWWSENAIDQFMKSFRESMYLYHIKGLDIMADKPEEARANILEVLKKIAVVNKSKPRSIMVITFLDTKAEELISIFSEGNMNVRREAYDLLKTMDPARNEEFKKILTN
ncbi:DUF4835 family protein [Reichenbachiella agarivorans]|uniref:DUF4835 family protein n=1 Tax=Reichenbachiella agarivorans TaxID=2979464 RepID=A0ABY6CKM5_9BACT|nr:DUF4835 family protein [Reichenbachiella agarivorans]UXP30640.1 DUF4835 family protein [Reichenbachiella agarivorans]